METNLPADSTIGREALNPYLENPIVTTPGTLSTQGLSTQTNISATSLSTGGLSGSFIIRDQGNISLYNSSNQLSIFIGF